MDRTRRLACRSLGFLVAGALGGCLFEDDKLTDADDTPARYATPEELIAGHARSLRERDLAAYIALLQPSSVSRAEAGFQWRYPQPQDLEDFPWLGQVDSWGLDKEIEIISNMFNPEFVSPTNGQSVDRIEAEFESLSIESETDSEVRATCHAEVTCCGAKRMG